MMGGRDNTQKNVGYEVKFDLSSNPCLSALGKLFNLSLSFPSYKMGLIVLNIKGNCKDWHRSAQ